MEGRKRRRCIYLSVQQKKKLLELMSKYPQLVSCKVTSDFTHKDSQKLWENVANECNSIPGAKKSWRQWRKTWHDLKCNTKKRQREINAGTSKGNVVLLSNIQDESDANMCDENQEIFEFENHNEGLNDGMSNGSMSELDSPMEEQVFTQTIGKIKNKSENNVKNSSDHSNCYLNCDVLALQEQKKIKIKEDYLNFKKKYLRQKLNLLKVQTEALKSIASELRK